jgi:DNA-directed RNA polymerase subunit RPC12/RpoP
LCPKCHNSKVKKNGIQLNRQSYKCKECGHRWISKPRLRTDFSKLYSSYLKKRLTLSDVGSLTGLSVSTIRKRFAAITAPHFLLKPAYKSHINLIFDATYFGREYGYIAFHDGVRIIYYEEIKTENIETVSKCLYKLFSVGYSFASFTIDGRRGIILLLKKLFPETPVQMCHFHQKAIITRYLTRRPRSQCGQDLRRLSLNLHEYSQAEFAQELRVLEEQHALFLNQQNQLGKPLHTRILSAIRSLKYNLPYLFAYKNYPELNIHNTTNKLENRFSHLKQNINIHRGLNTKNKKKLISTALQQP